MTSNAPRMHRRRFVRLVGFAASGAGTLLLACGKAAPPAAAPTPVVGQSLPTKSAAVFPTYQAAANRPAPDFPSDGPLYEDGYNNYPRNPVRSVRQTPGAGGAVTAFVQPLQPSPTPLEQNPAWQEVNRQLGAQFNFNMVPVADYRANFLTLMAGTDLPGSDQRLSRHQRDRQFAPVPGRAVRRLEPLPGGRVREDYPNLAAIPTFAWRNSGSVVDGRIYGPRRALRG